MYHLFYFSQSGRAIWDAPRRTFINNGGLDTYLYVFSKRMDTPVLDKEEIQRKRRKKEAARKQRQRANKRQKEAAAAAALVQTENDNSSSSSKVAADSSQ